MLVSSFMDVLSELGADLFTGVPDSLLVPFTDAVVGRYGIGTTQKPKIWENGLDKTCINLPNDDAAGKTHIVAANEGAAVGLAAGHYLATGKPSVVYMQNSGIGNAINPICSLLHDKVYGIPVIFVIGWRGEPGTKDEPQHEFQGEVTLKMLELVEIPYAVVTKEADMTREIADFKEHIANGRSVAFVVKKDALVNDGEYYCKIDSNSGMEKSTPRSTEELSREDALKLILNQTLPGDVFVCTTGKLSREVYEYRKATDGVHGRDFLTVGSMGHCLMIALGIAIAKQHNRVFCLDGDGSMLMHMGSVAVAGVLSPKNLVHVVINNGAHESVGGMPAASKNLSLRNIALSCGYSSCFYVKSKDELVRLFENKFTGPVFVEVACNLDSRENLGRPATTPAQNKKMFMERLK